MAAMNTAALIEALGTHDPEKRVITLDHDDQSREVVGIDSYEDALVLVTQEVE